MGRCRILRRVRHDRGTCNPITGLDTDMDQWLSNLSPLAAYLIAASAIMLGAIFLCGLHSARTPKNERFRKAGCYQKKVLDRADEQLGHTRQGGTPTGS